jgi:hypothetical protein
LIPLWTTQTPAEYTPVTSEWVNWRHPLAWEVPLLAESRQQARDRERILFGGIDGGNNAPGIIPVFQDTPPWL